LVPEYLFPLSSSCDFAIVGIKFFGAIGGYFAAKLMLLLWIVNIIINSTIGNSGYLALGKGFAGFIAVGLTMWVEAARVVQRPGNKYKRNAHITAARVLGFKFRIIFHRISQHYGSCNCYFHPGSKILPQLFW
jgi:ABC-type dipeptide/oligopeptide/nickel transport system permease subunit